MKKQTTGRMLLEAVGYEAVGCVIRRYANLNAVSNHDLNAVFLHSSRKHTPYGDVVIALDTHVAATQDLGDYTLQLN